MKNIFTDHPHSVGETYWQHCYFASQFGAKMLLGGFACLIHAVLPFLFKKTASRFLLEMTHRFVERMPKMEEPIIQLSMLIETKKLTCQAMAAEAK